ncbi:MAG: 23S rRNA (uracil(1939)-C(5))-methyltransferase RlmD, partial [bacterium]
SMKKGDTLHVEIDSLAFGGRGLARFEGFVIFVDNAIPGQHVEVRITRKRKGYAEARKLTIVKESPHVVSSSCRHFGECGGCRLQNLAYEKQLECKRQQVYDSLLHIGGLHPPRVLPTLASPALFYYRNKMEYSFGRARWVTDAEICKDEISKPKNFALGLHVRGRFDKILDLDTCYLQSEQSVEILNHVKEAALKSGVPAYSTRDHTGFWRHLVIREGKNTGDCMVNIVTADDASAFHYVKTLAGSLAKTFDVTTVVHNINRKKADVAVGDQERVLFGPGFIREKIGERQFQISAHSFFQTNTKTAEILYDKIIELADFRGDEIVFDLYSGAGSISLCIADKVKTVVGFEIGEVAIRDARTNSRLNRVENCTFVTGDLKETLAQNSGVGAKFGRPDTVVVDPPRAGMHPDVLAQLLHLSPEKIVYVSCNPATFARDAQEICKSDYELIAVQPVDMFPHTGHIEIVSLFSKK